MLQIPFRLMAAELLRTNSGSRTMRSLTCQSCGLTQSLPVAHKNSDIICAQCRSHLQQTPRGLQQTMALSLAALVLFIPANVLPILSLNRFGYQSESTIWQGVIELWHSGTIGIALIVLLCSILIPLAKIIGLFYLCCTWNTLPPKQNNFLLKFIEVIGRWSMLDVFLVAILVAVVKLGSFASVQPELGLVAFTAVVILTMIASANFDSRLFRYSRGTT